MGPGVAERGKEQPWTRWVGSGKGDSTKSCEGICPRKRFGDQIVKCLWRQGAYYLSMTLSIIRKLMFPFKLYAEWKSVSFLSLSRPKFSSVRNVTASQPPFSPAAPWRGEDTDTPPTHHISQVAFLSVTLNPLNCTSSDRVWRPLFLQIMSPGQVPSGHRSAQWAGAGMSPRAGDGLSFWGRQSSFLARNSRKHP